MDRPNQLKINPFTLNKKVALSENNVNLDMLNNLDTVNCNYYTPAKFQEQSINENSENFFSIFHLNIRSISNKFDMFKQLTSTLNKKFKVIGLTETWLNDDNANNFGLEGYKYIGVNRSNKKGGGVGIYATEKFNYKLRNDLSTNVDDVIESTFIEIIASTGKNIIVGVIYRPPNNKFDTFEIAMNGILNTIDKENKICYRIGDFNIDLLKSESCDYSNRFIEQLFTSSFFPLITKPTRFTAHTSTLIDNIFTNNIQQVDKSINGIIFSDISDHLPIVHMCSTNTTYNTNNDKISGSYYRRMINNNNISLFTESLKELTWDSVTIESDPIQCFKIFSEIFSGPKLAKQIKNRSNSTYEQYLTNKNLNSIFLRTIEEHEVENEIKNLNPNKIPGFDGYSANILKNIYQSISKPLTHIYNQTFIMGIVPD